MCVREMHTHTHTHRLGGGGGRAEATETDRQTDRQDPVQSTRRRPGSVTFTVPPLQRPVLHAHRSRRLPVSVNAGIRQSSLSHCLSLSLSLPAIPRTSTEGKRTALKLSIGGPWCISKKKRTKEKTRQEQKETPVSASWSRVPKKQKKKKKLPPSKGLTLETRVNLPETGRWCHPRFWTFTISWGFEKEEKNLFPFSPS